MQRVKHVVLLCAASQEILRSRSGLQDPLFIDIASINDLPLGRAKRLVAEGRTIALYHTSRGFFASDNTCPHRGGPLADGDLIGDEIICPWHLWGFDVASGICTGNPEISITTHELKIEGDRILVKLAPVREAAPEIL